MEEDEKEIWGWLKDSNVLSCLSFNMQLYTHTHKHAHTHTHTHTHTHSLLSVPFQTPVSSLARPTHVFQVINTPLVAAVHAAHQCSDVCSAHPDKTGFLMLDNLLPKHESIRLEWVINFHWPWSGHAFDPSYAKELSGDRVHGRCKTYRKEVKLASDPTCQVCCSAWLLETR